MKNEEDQTKSMWRDAVVNGVTELGYKDWLEKMTADGQASEADCPG